MEQRIIFLLKKRGDVGLTAAETAELTAFFRDEANRELFNGATAALAEDITHTTAVNNVDWEPLLSDILNADKTGHTSMIPMKVSYRKWWKYAAAAILVGAAGGLWLLENRKTAVLNHLPDMAADIAPGANKAVLQLANGKTVVLSDVRNGVIGQQGSMQIVKTDSGMLTYQPGQATTAATTTAYNTISTPRGGQYQVLLEDGSKVWLNAASSLKYPAVFNEKERVVELSGEAYFEVAAKAGQPFRVKSKGQEVLVLGTHFNINAYPDETVTATTLLSGKVKVSGAGYESILQPGQQVQQQERGNWQLVKAADTETAVAWKNGYFSFDRVDIVTVMRQLARWYNVNVIFETKNTQQAFVGEIPRSVSLEKALEILKFSDIHYIITGRTIKIVD